MRAPGARSMIGLVLAYLALGASVALIYGSPLGGLALLVAAIGMLGLALGVTWATSARRSRESRPRR